MPKILVVFYSRAADAVALAEAVGEGAESVRFTEVELRRLADGVQGGKLEAAPVGGGATPARDHRYPSLGSAEELLEYDGIVVGADTVRGAMSAGLGALFADAARLQAAGGLENKVGAAFASTPGPDPDAGWPIVRALAGLGMIIVPADGGGATSIDSARALGRRVARVTGWVHHALGHEHEHAHGRVHEHRHEQAHGHDHERGQEHRHGHRHGHDHPHGHGHEA